MFSLYIIAFSYTLHPLLTQLETRLSPFLRSENMDLISPHADTNKGVVRFANYPYVLRV